MPADIEIEPNWEAVFSYAIRIVETEIAKANGMETVKEMLQYGQRLHNARMFPPAS